MSTTDSQGEGWPELVRATKTIVVVDVVESVRLMQANEADVIDRWRRFVHEVRSQVLPAHQGRMVKSLGDGMLLEFDDVLAGVAAAQDMHRSMQGFNLDRVATDCLQLRIGVNLCEVVRDHDDIYGSGVNLAARLTSLAKPGGTAISMAVREHLRDGLDADLEDIGECWVKNLPEPIRTWRLSSTVAPSEPASTTKQGLEVGVAVLPFKSLAPGETDALLGELVAEELLTCLSKVPYLSVISQLSTMGLGRRSHQSPQTLAKLLGARFLVQGSCARSGDLVRLHVELMDARSQQVVWAESTSVDMAAVLSGQAAAFAELSAQISRALVGREAERACTAVLPTLESYALLFGAVGLLHRLSLDDFNRAREMLDHLCERHPRSPVPKAWLGKWHVMRLGQGWSPDPKEDGQRALWQTSSALDLAPDHAPSLALDGFVSGYVRKDFATAERRYEQALQANPNESLAWLYRSAMLGYREQHDLAVESALHAQRLSPLDPMRYYFDHFISLTKLLAGDYAGAIDYGLRSLRGNRQHASTLRALVMAQALDGQVEAARAHALELLRIEPGLTISAFRARYPGQRQAQVDRLAEALAMAGVPH
ncbi:adenylate/guanylate cyclase domain-containing protein [Paucibacter sp. XJ19-41]|uniref:adenylate/guanylate cyclase domain-containing protein n=1 Tax=Paucibacter sp. XJ19-41 TaxID=2927824 RepID=UPI00234BDDDD|nr:adenylate/guanylate cyclase domain-containing protein [Paucibacter sp. XJ19-41]MDC6170914.1 adenylate/guanylate cyclase domain-containing protein [Paucibacter sp. XJ19-41]